MTFRTFWKNECYKIFSLFVDSPPSNCAFCKQFFLNFPFFWKKLVCARSSRYEAPSKRGLSTAHDNRMEGPPTEVAHSGRRSLTPQQPLPPPRARVERRRPRLQPWRSSIAAARSQDSGKRRTVLIMSVVEWLKPPTPYAVLRHSTRSSPLALE